MLSISTNVYSKIFLHLNWHCKDDQALITPRLEQPLREFMEDYCTRSRGIKFFGVGGLENHIHLVIQMEPLVCLADWVGQIKGASSHELNKLAGLKALQWQRGYGVASFAERDLRAVQNYVADQRRHHQQGSIRDILEQYDSDLENIDGPAQADKG